MTEISIILPCRNEEKALPHCLKQIQKIIKKNRLDAEIIVSDSSKDKSPEVVRKFMKNDSTIKLLKHDKVGYGNAYLEGFSIAKGKYIFMADADGSYDFNELPKFIKSLKEGNDFVIGNRFGGKMEKSSMPMLHKHFGNPMLSGTLRLFFNTKVKDSHCGMRAIAKEALDKLKLKTTGMEFASEMVVKSIRNKLKIAQVNINYHKRIGETKLRSFRDGWRHLRFMLLYSPLFLFFIPGLFLFLAGFLSMFMLYFFGISIKDISLSIHPMFLSSLFVISGYQLINFAAFARIYAIVHLGDESKWFDRLIKHVTIERASIVGGTIVIFGALIYLFIFFRWASLDFGTINEIKNAIVALTFTVLGIQAIASAFMMSIIGIGER